MTFIYFVCITFALCYLAADARIFGADTTAWNQVYYSGDLVTDEDAAWVWNLGVLKIRQRLLWYNGIREHLSCYFCMGIWAGPAAHVLLWQFYRLRDGSADYWLQHPNTTYGWVLGLLCAFLVGACCSYFVNAVLHRIEGD